MKTPTTPIPQQESCLRCGIGKDDKPYGNCTGWGFFYNRHLWGETDPKPQQESWESRFDEEFLRNGRLENDSYLQENSEDLKQFIAQVISTERTKLLNEVKGIVEGMKDYKNGKSEPRNDYHCDCGYEYDDCTCSENELLADLLYAITKLEREK